MFSPIEGFAKYVSELTNMRSADAVLAFEWYTRGYTAGMEKAIEVQKEIGKGNQNYAPDTINGPHVAGISAPRRGGWNRGKKWSTEQRKRFLATAAKKRARLASKSKS